MISWPLTHIKVFAEVADDFFNQGLVVAGYKAVVHPDGYGHKLFFVMAYV